MKPVAGVFVILLAATSCAGRAPVATQPQTPTPAASALPETSPSLDQGLCAALSGGTDGVHMFLVAVRTGGHDSFDRITFEFEPSGRGPAAVPKFDVQSVTPPFAKDPSDQPMTVEGEGHTRVIFHGGTGVDLQGETYRQTYKGPSEIKPGLEVLVEAEEQGDFEATLSWIMGTAPRTCPRASEFSDPFRLSIDFPH